MNHTAYDNHHHHHHPFIYKHKHQESLSDAKVSVRQQGSKLWCSDFAIDIALRGQKTVKIGEGMIGF